MAINQPPRMYHHTTKSGEPHDDCIEIENAELFSGRATKTLSRRRYEQVQDVRAAAGPLLSSVCETRSASLRPGKHRLDRRSAMSFERGAHNQGLFASDMSALVALFIFTFGLGRIARESARAGFRTPTGGVVER